MAYFKAFRETFYSFEYKISSRKENRSSGLKMAHTVFKIETLKRKAVL
jgi:hypothetical protein